MNLRQEVIRCLEFGSGLYRAGETLRSRSACAGSWTPAASRHFFLYHQRTVGGQVQGSDVLGTTKEICLAGVNEHELQQARRSFRLMEIFAGCPSAAKVYFWALPTEQTGPITQWELERRCCLVIAGLPKLTEPLSSLKCKRLSRTPWDPDKLVSSKY